MVLRAQLVPLLDKYRQLDTGSSEGGGILLGYRRDPHIDVVRASQPGKRDVRRRMFFDRCDPSHQQEATKAWRESGKLIDYVGDWHTHAEAHPKPSIFDVNQWRLLREQTTHDPMLQVIVGTESSWVGIVESGEPRVLIPAE